jgi:hypothetical protein
MKNKSLLITTFFLLYFFFLLKSDNYITALPTKFLDENVLKTLKEFAISKENSSTIDMVNKTALGLKTIGGAISYTGGRTLLKSDNYLTKALGLGGMTFGISTVQLGRIYPDAHNVAKYGIELVKQKYNNEPLSNGYDIATYISKAGDYRVRAADKIIKIDDFYNKYIENKNISQHKNFFETLHNVNKQEVAEKTLNKKYDLLHDKEKLYVDTITKIAEKGILKTYAEKIASNLKTSGRADKILEQSVKIVPDYLKNNTSNMFNKNFVYKPTDKLLDPILFDLKESSLDVLKENWKDLTKKTVFILNQQKLQQDKENLFLLFNNKK